MGVIRKDLTGQRLGMLQALFPAAKVKNRTYWSCQCDCGNVVVVRSDWFRPGIVSSCGCKKRERALRGEPRRIHGMTNTPEHDAYVCAKQRCQNRNLPGYHNYGGRGIEFRFTSFEQFFSELGKRPSEEHSIDRINNNGHYEPGNVRWATWSEQMKNRRPHSEWMAADLDGEISV